MRFLSALFVSACLLVPSVSLSSGDDEECDKTIVVVDSYELKLTLRVPQVIDNMSSQGYRKNQTQRIKGLLNVLYYDDGSVGFDFGTLTNLDYKIRGTRVTYTAGVASDLIYPRWNYIGNNRTEVFNTPSVCMYIEAYPSYAIVHPETDNSLYLMLSGSGSSGLKNGSRIPKCVSGYVAGTQGCSCSDYGHISPTRRIWACGALEDGVDDVAAVYGKWTLRFKRRSICK